MFSALNGANRGPPGVITPLFEYTNDGGATYTDLLSNISPLYNGSVFTIRVKAITPAGATFTQSGTASITNANSANAQITITGSGGYTGSVVSPSIDVVPITITARSAYTAIPIDPDTCTQSQSVAGFNLTLSGLLGSGTGVPVSILTGSTYAGATLCLTSGNINITDRVSTLEGASPYQNRVYNTNGVITIYMNLNNVPYWCVVNDATMGGASYNPNYTTAIAATAGGTISPASFTNSCQT
jgi:hypothetical protein